MTRKLLAVLTLSLAAAYHAPAQEADDSGRGVARLSLLAGDVSVRRGDTGEWVAAAINAALLGEDQVLTGPNSRAEVQFDYAHFARLSANTELRLADIENRRYLVRLARGTMTFRVLRSNEAGAEISTPSIAVRPLKKGIYRVSVTDDGTTEVTVRNGEAEIYTPRGSQKLKSGRTLMARGNASDPEFQTINALMIDDFDRWSESRDRQLENSRSYDYVSRDIYGAEDLDGHGRWVNTPEYGNVWVPNTSEGWAPYRYGRWSWVDYYGWNWISYDPWGWAPYHYGRWIHRPAIGWCWWPGRMHSRHYWSPGLVAFFGWGGRWGGVSVGVGLGNWGWVPLAPFETYYPWYGRGYYGGYRNRTVNNITVINNTNITNIYRNARIDNAITSVNEGQFGRGSVNNVRYNRADIERASVVRGQLPLVPDATSTRMSDRESRLAADRGASRGNDRFFSTREASRIDRVPFENQRAAIADTSRRAFGADSGAGRGGEVAGGGRGRDTSAPALVDRGSDRNAGRGADTGGWRRMGDTPSDRGNVDRGNVDRGSVDRGSMDRGSMDRGTSGRGSDSGGWRRFGDSAPDRGASVDRGTSRGNTDSGSSWRRFGDSTGGGASVDRGTSRDSSRGSDGGSWRRMDSMPDINRGASRGGGDFGRGSSVDRGTSVDRSSPVDRGTFDRGTFGRGSSDRGGRGSGSWDSSPRMSAPPVVRERSTPDYGGRGGGGGWSGGGRMSSPAPRMESAPRMERSAPSGGGGGGMRGGGGDFGGGRGAASGGGSRGESRGGGGRQR